MSTNWEMIIFSGEKKCNFDGPDSWNYYWRDLRKEPKIFSTRNFGGFSYGLRGAFTTIRKLQLVFISTRMDSVATQYSSVQIFMERVKQHQRPAPPEARG